MFDRLSLETEFPPLIDEPAGFDDAAAGGQPHFLGLPPNAPDGDDGMELTVIPEAEGSAKLGWAT